MFKHILVPLDGSALAEAVLPAAVEMARLGGARLTLIHLVERDAPEAVHGQAHLRNAAEATVYLEEAAARAVPAGIPVTCHVHDVAFKTVSEGIVAHAAEMDHDLIAMCAHGQGRAFRFLLGSIAQRIVEQGTIPVLVVQPDESGAAAPFAFRVILAPLDGGSEHIEGLPMARELASASGAVLYLAVVVNRFETLRGQRTVTSRLMPGATVQLLEMAAEEAVVYLDKLRQTLSAEGLTVRTQVLRGDPAKALALASGEVKADLLVLATHGKTGLSAFWSGSVAHQICSVCKLPLLLIPLHC